MQRTDRQKLAVFRADASIALGAGHVMRCLTLANALRRSGWNGAFATASASLAAVPVLREADLEIIELPGAPEGEPAALAARWPGGADLLVVDHYARDRDFERACR